MSLIKSKRPSPWMLVAVAALAFAMVGTAVAGPSAVSKLTKSKVKSISKKQADKELKANVSGSHVNLADKATDADKAKTADTATNADAVNGKTANDLQTSSGFNQSAAVVTDLGTTFVSVAGTATITTTAAGRVLATGSAELFGDGTNGDTGQCRIVIDGTPSLAYETDFDDIGADNQAVVAVNFARSLPAGTHTATLDCRRSAGTAVGKDDAAINLYGLGA